MPEADPPEKLVEYWLDDLAPGEEAEINEALDAMLAADSPLREPPAGLRESVLAAAAAEEAPAPASSSGGSPVRSITFLPWALAAGMAVTAGLWLMSLVENRRLSDEVAKLEAVALATDLRVRDMQSDLDNTFKAFVVWDEARGTGVLRVENLPGLGEDGDYQLWVVSEGYENPLDGGVFDTENGRAEMQIVTRKLAADPAPAKGVTLFAISRERPGGVPISENGVFVLTASN